jgi:hypothetical protein
VAVGRLSVVWRTEQSGAPPDTVRCASHVSRPLGSDRWSSDWWGLWAFCACSVLCARRRALNALQSTVACEVAVAPLAHRTLSGASPDSPVNYSGAASHFPEGSEFSFRFPGAPDTVRWHTGQSDAPDQGAFWDVFSSLYLNPSLVFLLACCEPLAPVKLFD